MSTEVTRRADVPAAAIPPLAATAGFIGQATAVEQARAVAEVQAAIVVAQQVPRNTNTAIDQMRESCAQQGLAERAFYKFPRAGGSVTGPSIHLARELARCWGNIQYGIHELRRDDAGGFSEMQAWAWDVQTNTRNSSTFVVPHKRDTRDGVKEITELRDIYENNANAGARRVRQAIFAVLPTWFTEDAKNVCAKALREGPGDRPLSQRIAGCIGVFKSLGITEDQLEQKVGAASRDWTPVDLANLIVTHASIERGEVRAVDEFPPRRVTASEIAEQAAAPVVAEPSEAEAELIDPDDPSVNDHWDKP